MPDFITTPNGNVVSGGSGGNPVLDLVLATVTWNGVVEQFADSYTAQLYYNQVLASMVAVNVGTPSSFIQDLRTTPVIFTTNPKTFSVANDGTFLQVIGTGFTSVLTGLHMYIEGDDGGGLDNNGYYMVLTYINPNLCTAVYGDHGDFALPAGPAFVYILNGATVISNVLAATSTGHVDCTVQ